MTYLKLNLSEKLKFIEEAIQITVDDPILAEGMNRFGMAEEVLNEGLELQQSVSDFFRNQELEYGKRLELTATVEERYAQIEKSFRKDRLVARTVLKDKRGLIDQLHLGKEIARKREGLVLQTRLFYTELLNNETLRGYLEAYSFNQETIQLRLAGVEGLADAMKQQQVKRAEAILATQKRQQAMDELDNWTAQFIGIARQAFRSDKKQLEKLGIRS